MPTSQNGTVVQFAPSASALAARPRPPARRRNGERRPREHLTPTEVERLVETARKRGRYGQRDAAAILIAYTHGLRVSELVGLTWSQIDFADGVIHVTRLKNGRPSTQPLRGAELRALRQLRRDWAEGRFVFQNERGTPMTAAGFRKTLARIGETAGFSWLVHPHQLRHATGYALANRGTDTRTLQHYLGHRSIEHTVRYSELAADRFAGLWHD
jgi:type 1 fimbriae regulatory protein FimB/type 1 fimbriae regulatory protein FimE